MKLKEYINNPGFIKYFKNTSWLLLEKVLRMVTGLLIGVWVARYLGPNKFGLFSYVQSFVAIFSVIATVGLDSIVVRELVKNKEKINVLLGTAFRLKFIGALTVVLLLAISMLFSSNDVQTNVLIFIVVGALIFQSFNVIDFYFQSAVISRFTVYANIVSLSVSSILKIVLILNQAPLIAFALVLLFDSIVLSLGYIYIYFKQGLSIRKWEFDKQIAYKMFKESYPLVIAGVVNSIYMKIDQVMIKEIMNTSEVGVYSAAVRLSEVWFGVGVIICNSLFPSIINAKSVSEEFYYERIRKLFFFLISISYVLSILVYLLSDFIILTLYGVEFERSSSILAIHIFSSIFVYLGVSSGRWLINENKTLYNLYRNIFGLIINISLNWFLIRSYGIVGVAYASLLAYIGAFYIFDLFSKDTRKIFILKTKSLVFLR